MASSNRNYTEQDLNYLEQLSVLFALAVYQERSERTYREIFDAANDAIVVHDKDTGLIEDANYKTCEMLGYSLEEVKKLTVGDWSSGFSPYTEQNSQKMIRKVKSGESIIFDWQLKDSNGRIFWTEVNLKKVVLAGKEQIVAVVREITERKIAHEKLRESEAKYKTLFEASRDAIVLLTPDKYVIDCNCAALNIYGCATKEEFTSKTIFRFFPEYQPDNTLTLDKVGMIDAIVNEKGSCSFELTQKRSDGTLFLGTVLLNNMVIGGEVIQQATLRDITEQKRIEQALQNSEQKFRSVFWESPIGLLIYGFDGLLIDINKAGQDLFQLCCREKSTYHNLFDAFFVSNDKRERLKSLVPISYEASFGKMDIEKEGSEVTKEEGDFHFYIDITPLSSGQDEPGGYLVQIQNVTEKHNAEERIRILSRKIIESQEEQRRRISRELHDGVAQELSTLNLNLKTIADHPRIADSGLAEMVSKMSNVAQGTITGVRDLAYFLHPPGLDQLGLVRAISEYCEDFGKESGLDVKFYTIGLQSHRLPFQTEINLFRLVQEALNNVRKHADAEHVTVRLAASVPNIILRVTDDGKGFDVQKRLGEALKCKHMGIEGMQERVRMLGGKIEIHSQPLQGTRLVVEVPYHEIEAQLETIHENPANRQRKLINPKNFPNEKTEIVIIDDHPAFQSRPQGNN